jgi:hypothetical protein
MTAIEQLKNLAKASLRAKLLFASIFALTLSSYSVRSVNDLTKSIIDWLVLNGHQAQRLNNKGEFVKYPMLTKDCMGNAITIRRTLWVEGASRKSNAKIYCRINGIPIMVDIHALHSQASNKYDLKHRLSVNYWTVKSFDEFMKNYNELINTCIQCGKRNKLKT